MTHPTRIAPVLTLVAALLAGCAVPRSGWIDPTQTMALPAEATSLPVAAGTTATEKAPPLAPGAGAATERAIQVLAAGLGLDAEDIALGEIESVDWADTSLGCPLPGMAYAEVITAGYRVTLTASGVEYAVHLDTLGTAIVCSPDGNPLPGSIPILPGERIMDGQPWMPVN